MEWESRRTATALIDTRAEYMSTLMANTIYDLLHRREVGSSILVRSELVVRGSTKSPCAVQIDNRTNSVIS